MSALFIKIFWIGLIVFLSIGFIFLGTVGIPVTQTTIVKTIPKERRLPLEESTQIK